MSEIKKLPQWKCHKVVSAAKIVAIRDGQTLDLGEFGEVTPGYRWMQEKHAEPGGYYVVYDDGYASFSPAKAFEDGYTRLSPGPNAAWPFPTA